MKRLDFVTQPSRVKPIKRRKMKKRRPKKDATTKVEGRTWSGRWQDGSIGWGISNFVNGDKIAMTVRRDGGDWWWNTEPGDDWDKMFLCKVTVEQIFDKNGKPIVRYKSRMRK